MIDDNYFMKIALRLAAKGRGMTSPNPMVGSVIMKNGKVIAQDFHRKAGTPHAEVLALKKAGAKALGATLYVNLEPCCHTNKRTPPCTAAIIKSGISKVVVAMIDPNPLVSGQGLRLLKKAGIECSVNVMENEARQLNEAFIKYVTTSEPFVILKTAQSLDGKIATASGESQWITGASARAHVHRIRNESDAIIVGIGTVLKDNPSLDCRIKGGLNPYRIILDSGLKIPLDARVLRHNDGRTIIVSSTKADKARRSAIRNLGHTVITARLKSGKIDLKHLMQQLASMGIMSIVIEGGSQINASAFAAKIVDKVMIYIAPKIIGGSDAIGWIGGKSPSHLADAIELKGLNIKKLGEDILLQGYTR
ncbi:MAG: bifunctional diaminohydroxyphosphoribosylaminopyrimidine deaminase/5-amino-6-(5-phosphoribosylamino)uracil reductase RibD [Nitrospira sp.]|nr:bifunctional diaminohydroxyphosphoribosylaminopyrimidine deaminase/5-amino-6-(5-phosphoribosylamino)uracil reductase RibD [bacterium]MBL7049531.1 bifunctional diaminohydroxyphosphoribosylaminopyrimidine deaminase/5-amino-6-(5-phosphoribosylamino)uracil reductase RibD [Nitrospira sp.]